MFAKNYTYKSFRHVESLLLQTQFCITNMDVKSKNEKSQISIHTNYLHKFHFASLFLLGFRIKRLTVHFIVGIVRVND